MIKILDLYSESSEEELEGETEATATRYGRASIRRGSVGFYGEAEKWIGGASGILPEMVKAASCEEAFMSALMDLVSDVWRKCRVPGNWRDAILVPIPKKGDLSSCDYYMTWHFAARCCWEGCGQSSAGVATKTGGRGIT